jgi:hypothetical protein
MYFAFSSTSIDVSLRGREISPSLRRSRQIRDTRTSVQPHHSSRQPPCGRAHPSPHAFRAPSMAPPTRSPSFPPRQRSSKIRDRPYIQDSKKRYNQRGIKRGKEENHIQGVWRSAHTSNRLTPCCKPGYPEEKETTAPMQAS